MTPRDQLITGKSGTDLDEALRVLAKGRIEKLFKEQVLMEQEFVKEPGTTIEDRLKTAISKLGENMAIRRFTRYELGSE